MKPNFTLWKGVSFAFIAALMFTQFSCKRGPEKENEKENLMSMLDARYKQEFMQTVDPALGRVPTERLLDAQKYMKKNFSQLTNSAVAGITWQERGPNNVGGRTRAIIFDRNDATNKTCIAGAVFGGLWKNTNVSGGGSWTKITDVMDNIQRHNESLNEKYDKNAI